MGACTGEAQQCFCHYSTFVLDHSGCIRVQLKFLLGTENTGGLFYYPFTAWYIKGFKKIQPIDHRAYCP